jgi:hypothetical protein
VVAESGSPHSSDVVAADALDGFSAQIRMWIQESRTLLMPEQLSSSINTIWMERNEGLKRKCVKNRIFCSRFVRSRAVAGRRGGMRGSLFAVVPQAKAETVYERLRRRKTNVRYDLGRTSCQ